MPRDMKQDKLFRTFAVTIEVAASGHRPCTETKSDILLTLFILPIVKLDGREHKQGLTVNISPDLISQIEKLCNEYSGGCPLYLKIQDDK